MFVNPFRVLRMVVDAIEQRIRLSVIHPHHALGHQAVDEDSLAAGFVMTNEDGMGGLIDLRATFAIAALLLTQILAMERLLALKLLLDVVGEGFIGGIGIGKAGIATM